MDNGLAKGQAGEVRTHFAFIQDDRIPYGTARR